jgi:hypothetical protein
VGSEKHGRFRVFRSAASGGGASSVQSPKAQLKISQSESFRSLQLKDSDMEPASVVSLLFGCAKVIKYVYDVRGKFKRAPLALVSIASECSTIHVILTQLEQIEAELGQIDHRKQFLQSLSVVTSSCSLTLGCVEDILEEVLGETPDEGTDVLSQAEGTTVRAKFLMQEEELKELLGQLREYRNGMGIMLTTITT